MADGLLERVHHVGDHVHVGGVDVPAVPQLECRGGLGDLPGEPGRQVSGQTPVDGGRDRSADARRQREVHLGDASTDDAGRHRRPFPRAALAEIVHGQGVGLVSEVHAGHGSHGCGARR